MNEGSNFVFDHVEGLFYKFHEVNLGCGGSNRDSPKWLKNKATINPKNKNDDMCFKYRKTDALNHESIGKHPDRVTKIVPFIDQYNWKDKFPRSIKIQK